MKKIFSLVISLLSLNILAQTVVIPEVPVYYWYRGCGPTSLGVVAGYWDMHGFPDLIPGDASTQTPAVDDIIASDEHFNDYVLPQDDETTGILPDKSSLGGAHPSNSLADYLGTSQSIKGNLWMWTLPADMKPAWENYISERVSNYVGVAHAYGFNDFPWDSLVNNINRNHPMVFLVDYTGDGVYDHFVTVIGYRIIGGIKQYGCLDTWASNIRWSDFRIMENNFPWGVLNCFTFDIFSKLPAPVVGVITQPTCSLGTGSVFLSGLPSGNWVINPGNIAGSTTSTTISNLVHGTYNFTVNNADGITSTESADVVINAQPVTPAAPTAGSITQPTCSLATGSILLNGLPSGTWTINPGNITGSGTSITISGLIPGTYNYTVTNASGCTSVGSGDMVLNSQPATPAAPTVGTITQPTCAVETGSVVLNGLPAGTWTINPGNITGTGTSRTISGLATGTYNYTVTGSSGCTSVPSGNVIINSQPATPAAPAVGTITQPTCAVETGSVVLSGLPAGTWTINPGNITGTGTSRTISGLATGTYNYMVTGSSGCTSVPSGNVIINSQPATPAAPAVGTITKPTCAVETGSVVLNGLPAGTWTINPGNITGTGSSRTISGLATGTYNYTVTGSSGCTSVPSGNVIINSQPATPAAPAVGTITQPTCAVETGSVVLNGLPAGTWTINPGNITGTGTSRTISGLATGTYNYTVTGSSGCTSVPSGNVIINSQPATPVAPAVGTITQPTCSVATGSVLLNGLPSGSWTINPGNITGSGTSRTISGLATGTYNYTVTGSSGCTSVPSGNVIINSQPVTPAAPAVGTITQPTCAVEAGSVVLNGLPAGTWTINPGNITGTGSSRTISGLVSGTYNYTVTGSSGCTSVPSGNVIINSQPATPAAPAVGTITQPTCAVETGSVVLNGLPAGTWTINPGNITGTGSSRTISGLATGTYNYTVTGSSGCTSVPSGNVIINSQPATPAAPAVGTITQPTCSVATGSVLLNGLPSGSWTINPGNITGTGSSRTISGLASGTYNYTVTGSSGCTSVPSGNVIINSQPATPITPQITLNVNVLHSDASAGNQWYNQYGSIVGSVFQDHTVTISGDYYVVVTLNGCSSNSSNIIYVTPTGIELTSRSNGIIAYPNPVSDELTIEKAGNTASTKFEIINSLGKVVFNGNIVEKTVVQTSGFSSGVYIIRIENGKSFDFIKVIKK